MVSAGHAVARGRLLARDVHRVGLRRRAHQTDAYVAAFQIPDFLNYILAGGTASITFISIYTRHTSRGRDREAQAAFNSTITIMTAVVCVARCCWRCSRRKWCG